MNKLISIIGLTSSGKSDLGIKLAEYFNGEIVSADSRQVYKGLDYCSGKVTADEQKIVPHHLLDVENLGVQFTLYDFQSLAYSAIDDIIQRNKVPFLVGGTGLYSRAVVEGYNLESSSPDAELREKLENLSLNELKDICKKLGLSLDDEVTSRRLIRLIEKSNCNINDKTKNPNNPRYEVLQIGIMWSREKIYERIKLRLESRMPNMIKEIEELIAGGVDVEFLKSLGLEAKCVAGYLLGEYSSYEEFFEELYKQERHFAKRQQTWYNKEKNLIWLDAEDNLFENAKKLISDFLAKK